MKQKVIILTVIALTITSQLVNAGSITDTYTKGDTLTATKMDNIKTAVNGNAGDISTNAANIDINAFDISTNIADIASVPRLGDNLPTGTTIRGFFGLGWTADAASEHHETGIAFGYTLASAPTVHFIEKGSASPVGCPGSSINPQADPGHACFYEDNTGNTTNKQICSSTSCPSATRWGVQFRANSSGGGVSWSRGTWAVSAP